ncbi:MAG: molecular chaperone TorD family protein [Aeoliella sp.]
MTTQSITRIAQADLLLLIADMLRPPSALSLPDTKSWQSNTQLGGQLPEMDDRELRSLVETTELQPTDRIEQELLAAVRCCQAMPPDQWSACYRALFDGAVLCPINEATYIRRDKGTIIGDLCGFFSAFGWQSAMTGERPDHLLVELEFAAMLLIMSARAETDELDNITTEALAEFTRQHLNDWVALFCQQLRLSTTHDLFVSVANLLETVWSSLINYHAWPVDEAPTSPMGICEEPDDPYDCGAPDLVSLEPAGDMDEAR